MYQNIKIFHAFRDEEYKSNAFIVTNDDMVYAFGKNKSRVLGLGHENEVKDIAIIEELCHKRVIDFKTSRIYVYEIMIKTKIF